MSFIERDLENLQQLHGLDEYMIGHKGFVAGGVFKDLFSHTRFKDIDIFFRNEADWAQADSYYRESEDYVFSYENDKVKAYKNKYTNVRVEIINTVFGTPQEIISNFDFTVAKFAYYKDIDETGEVIESRAVHHEHFFEHLQMKRLVIDDKLVKPISTFERTYKYRDKGFRLCRESKINLLRAIIDTDADTLDEALGASLYDGLD